MVKIPSILSIALAASLLVTGCSQKQNTAKSYPKAPNRYQVQSGDTVSQIAQRYGLDWRSLSRINRLDENHTIYAGQWLTLKGASPLKTTTRPTAPKPSQTTQNSTPPRPPIAPSAPPPPHSAPPPAQNSAFVGSSAVMLFRYPVSKKNPIVKNFAAPINQGATEGIFFSGKDGDTVSASLNGTVINIEYTGARPYVLLDHNNGYQSVYFDLKNIQVSPNQTLKTGDYIGQMQTQTQSGLALFEFRIARQGQYIDPISVLK